MSLLLIGCAAFFLFEGLVGFLKPGIHGLLEPDRRRECPWRLPLIGGVLAAWGIVCLAASLPPGRLVEWFLAVLGVPFTIKGLVMVFRPSWMEGKLRTIEAKPRGWRISCALRCVIGLLLAGWGIVQALEA